MNKEAIIKFVAALGMALAGFFTASCFSQEYTFSLLVGWDLFGLTYLVISLVIFARVPQDRIREICSREDLRTWVLFLVVLVACIAGLITVLSFFASHERWAIAPWLASVTGIGAVVVSWAMVHTSFAFRYAHLYYGDDNQRFSEHARGLTFPEDDAPDYYDFAYFSFVIGMTFQVSDVVITSKVVRRLALLHSIVSFVFNTVIIALTISELVSMR